MYIIKTDNGEYDTPGGSMGDADVSGVHYVRERRRSSIARPMRDQEEILETLRSLKAQSAKGELGRTMSLSGEKKRPNRKYDTIKGYFEIMCTIYINFFSILYCIKIIFPCLRIFCRRVISNAVFEV